MSSDLINALRDHSKLTNLTGGYPLDRPTMTSKAADMIEMLETALEGARDALSALEMDTSAEDAALSKAKGDDQ